MDLSLFFPICYSLCNQYFWKCFTNVLGRLLKFCLLILAFPLIHCDSSRVARIRATRHLGFFGCILLFCQEILSRRCLSALAIRRVPKINPLALWCMGFNVHSQTKCAEACPGNQALSENLCWTDVHMLLSITGHVQAIYVILRSCLLQGFPGSLRIKSQHEYVLVLWNHGHVLRTLHYITYMYDLYWTIYIGSNQGKQMFSSLVPKTLDIPLA